MYFFPSICSFRSKLKWLLNFCQFFFQFNWLKIRTYKRSYSYLQSCKYVKHITNKRQIWWWYSSICEGTGSFLIFQWFNLTKVHFSFLQNCIIGDFFLYVKGLPFYDHNYNSNDRIFKRMPFSRSLSEVSMIKRSIMSSLIGPICTIPYSICFRCNCHSRLAHYNFKGE